MKRTVTISRVNDSDIVGIVQLALLEEGSEPSYFSIVDGERNKVVTIIYMWLSGSTHAVIVKYLSTL
jgi:hypothetical protein